MSLALIEESAKEVRRLAIAGSPLAVGDFRLKKLIPPLELAGAKVPVFAQVAKAMSDVVNGPETESAARLLSLSTLLNAILYTQGQSSAAGTLQPLENYPTRCTSTRTTARVLKPLVEALTASGGGRFEVVKSTVERGTFNDLRLIDPAIQALSDSYPELADLVADKVLPAFGPGIVLRLKSGWDIQGKRADARKLEVMHRLDATGTLALCKQALEDGSVEVKVAAIGCLGKHEDCLPLVLEQAQARNKQLRAAALEALAEHDRPEITKIFTELIQGKNLDLLVRPFRTLRNRAVLKSLLEEGTRAFQAVLQGDAETIQRWMEILDCLAERTDAEVEQYLITCISNAAKIGKVKAAKNSIFGGPQLVSRLALQLSRLDTTPAAEAILAQREALHASAFPQVLQAALRLWSPEKVFQAFSPLLEASKGADKEKADHLVNAIVAAHWDEPWIHHSLSIEHLDALGTPPSRQHIWDPRWLDAAIKADQRVAVCSLARPQHKAALQYLLKLTDTKKSSEAGMTVRALVRCEYPKVTDFFLDLITKKTKNAKYLDHELQFLMEKARHLPPATLPQLDAFAAQLDEKFLDAFLVAIHPLRQTPQS